MRNYKTHFDKLVSGQKIYKKAFFRQSFTYFSWFFCKNHYHLNEKPYFLIYKGSKALFFQKILEKYLEKPSTNTAEISNSLTHLE